MLRVIERLMFLGIVEGFGIVGFDLKLFEFRLDRDGMGVISGVNGLFEIVFVIFV